MRLSIILLNYKRKELTAACIASVYKQYQKQFEKNEFELIVIDNFSEDDSVAFLKKTFPRKDYKNIYVIPNSENAGFGRGCNFGAQYAKGEYLLFLNNDTQVLDTGFLGMMDFLDARPRVGIVGGKMENENRTPQPSTGKFYTLYNATLMLLGLERFGIGYTSPTAIKKVDWVSGSSLMIRRAIFEKIGGFDKEIFMYVEDVDICYRVKKIGYLTYFYPFVTITHVGQGSTNRTFAIVHIYEGLLHFYKKHYAAWQVWVLQCILKMKAIVLITLGKLLHKQYLISTYEEALNVVR